MRSTHSQRLERWLGADAIADMTRHMRGWYGPPIAVASVPGAVYATADGDFIGEIRGGQEATALDYAREFSRRLLRSRTQLNSGFATISELLANGKKGLRQELIFNYRVSTCPSYLFSFWPSYGGVGHQIPPGGTAGSAAPAGRVPVGGTDGGFPFRNAPSAKTTHFVEANLSHLLASFTYTTTLLLYDRLFDVAKSMSSTATEAVTGVPTRYQSTTATDADYIGGNFCFPEVMTTLGAGAHNWNVCSYTNQANAAGNFASVTGVSGSLNNSIDQVLSSYQWFMALAAGDVGVKALTQMQCSASITGAVNFVIGHPIAFFPMLSASPVFFEFNGLTSALNLARVFDDACLSMLLLPSASRAGVEQVEGTLTLVAG